MRRRFWISLVLSLPVIAYSSLGMLLLGGRQLPTPFGIPADWIMLVFATPVALWTSSVFHIGAFYALKSRVLNMSVLVSLGILTSYLFSVGLTLFAPGQDTFYEAAVMLAVFLSIFAHGLSAAPGARLLCRFVPLEQQSNPAMPPVSATRQTLLTQPTI